jgi:hypothetical protein
MHYRAVFRVMLALLVVAVQVAGSTMAAGTAPTPDQGIYFCCCIGECACTADCCHHPPSDGEGGPSPPIRLQLATPVLESPTNCGVWRATLQRGPDQGKVIVNGTGERAEPAPPTCRTQLHRETPFVPSEGILHHCSPRAPPAR